MCFHHVYSCSTEPRTARWLSDGSQVAHACVKSCIDCMAQVYCLTTSSMPRSKIRAVCRDSKYKRTIFPPHSAVQIEKGLRTIVLDEMRYCMLASCAICDISCVYVPWAVCVGDKISMHVLLVEPYMCIVVLRREWWTLITFRHTTHSIHQLSRSKKKKTNNWNE